MMAELMLPLCMTQNKGNIEATAKTERKRLFRNPQKGHKKMPRSVLYKASQAGSGTSRRAVLLNGQVQRPQKPVAGFGETDFFQRTRSAVERRSIRRTQEDSEGSWMD